MPVRKELTLSDAQTPRRTLMGPGPSNCHPSVLGAMARPLVGHLDPAFIELMDETQDRLRRVMQSANELTLPVSGTGSAGMEACLANLIEPADPVLVCINGVFGTRMADIVGRLGGELHTVEAQWGEPVRPEQVQEAVNELSPKVVALVHAETSTGVRSPVEAIAPLAREAGALTLVDAVTSLGGCDVKTDRWGLDAVYSGTQKCLSCPPGLAPVSFGARAVEAIDARRTKVASWYLDMTMVRSYWGEERKYHHTAPVSMIYALHQALGVILKEGLPARFARHQQNHRALVAGLEAMGLEMLVEEPWRLTMLNAVRIPAGADDRRVRGALLREHGIEIGGGLGPLAGRIWRIGLMGYSSTPANVLALLDALEEVLCAEGAEVTRGGRAAAEELYAT